MQQPEEVGRRASGRPLYRAIADELLAGIGQGIFPVGHVAAPARWSSSTDTKAAGITVREALRGA